MPLQGINLIGFTHAPGRVDFLQKSPASPAEPSQRPVAIAALGMVCDDEARRLSHNCLRHL